MGCLEEYQSMELIKNKRIGKILFIVEGGKHEFNLIKKIFGDILGYKRIEKRRNRATYNDEIPIRIEMVLMGIFLTEKLVEIYVV